MSLYLNIWGLKYFEQRRHKYLRVIYNTLEFTSLFNIVFLYEHREVVHTDFHFKKYNLKIEKLLLCQALYYPLKRAQIGNLNKYMAVTVERTYQGCALHKTQVTSSLTISILAHHLKYKQHLIAWEIGYFAKKKNTLLSSSPCSWEPDWWSTAETVQLCREASLSQKGSNSVQSYVRRGGKVRSYEQIQWMPGLNAETLDLF